MLEKSFEQRWHGPVPQRKQKHPVLCPPHVIASEGRRRLRNNRTQTRTESLSVVVSVRGNGIFAAETILVAHQLKSDAK
jgi:hypothetical protein